MSIYKNSRILLADNTEKCVYDLKAGDLVWSVNLTTKHLKPSKILRIEYLQQDLIPFQDTYLSTDQFLYVSNNKNHPKFRKYKSLIRKDATYLGRIWKLPYIRKQVNYKDFVKGYLRGFVDGDGHIGDGITDHGVWVGQKLSPILDEFWNLYSTHIASNNVKVHFDKTRKMYIGKGGNANYFRQVTNFQENNLEYLRGYLNGIIMADGCISFSKNNKNLHINIAQSVSANLEKCNNIDTCLNALNIKYNYYQRNIKGFKEETIMGAWIISYPYIIPFIFGKDKKENFFKEIYKYNGVNRLDNKIISKINKYSYKLDSFNIKTEENTYFCNGFLLKCDESE